MGASKRTVEFFYDVISGYSWFAFEVLCRYQKPWNLSLNLRPIFLGALFKAADNKGPAIVPNKFPYVLEDYRRLAKYFGVPMNIPKDPLDMILTKGTLQPQRFLTAVDMHKPEMLEQVTREIWMRAYSTDEDISRPESLAEAAIKAGMAEKDVTTLVPMIKEDRIKERLKKTTQDALDLGAFGVPVIATEIDGSKKWVFGSDRFHILADMIGIICRMSHTDSPPPSHTNSCAAYSASLSHKSHFKP